MNRVERLCRQYTNYIAKIAKSLFDDEKLVEDVVQITYLKIAENIDKIEEIDSNNMKSYINSIVKNVARDIYKINKKEENKIDKLKRSLEHGDIAIKNKSLEEEVFLKIYLEGILDCLEEDEKKMILLKQVYGYKNKEIAKIFKLKEKNTSKKLNNIKLKLKKEIMKHET
ncbi:RNA polymerase sigma factor [Intestinibacter sp.]|uniref:RNA polymerase sigma factor n=1 Tax=Intestinibacter sp. TaxID=1965304 RepID=UPI003F153C76